MYLKELIAKNKTRCGRLTTQPAINIKKNCQQKRILSMSKCEELVLQALHEQYKDGAHIAQQVRNVFMLAGGVMYIPDFVVFRPNGVIEIIEVKGGYRGPGYEQGEERYKSAAAQYGNKAPFNFSLWRVNSKDKSIDIEQWGQYEGINETTSD